MAVTTVVRVVERHLADHRDVFVASDRHRDLLDCLAKLSKFKVAEVFAPAYLGKSPARRGGWAKNWGRPSPPSNSLKGGPRVPKRPDVLAYLGKTPAPSGGGGNWGAAFGSRGRKSHVGRRSAALRRSGPRRSRPSHSAQSAVRIGFCGFCLALRKRLGLISDLIPSLLGFLQLPLGVCDCFLSIAKGREFHAPSDEIPNEKAAEGAN
jgi:hypothetical protein